MIGNYSQGGHINVRVTGDHAGNGHPGRRSRVVRGGSTPGGAAKRSGGLRKPDEDGFR